MRHLTVYRAAGGLCAIKVIGCSKSGLASIEEREMALKEAKILEVPAHAHTYPRSYCTGVHPAVHSCVHPSVPV